MATRAQLERELARLEKATSAEARAADRERFRLRAVERIEAAKKADEGGLAQRAKSGVARKNEINRAALELVRRQQAAQFSDSHQDN